jgi:hypothetical protein
MPETFALRTAPSLSGKYMGGEIEKRHITSHQLYGPLELDVFFYR